MKYRDELKGNGGALILAISVLLLLLLSLSGVLSVSLAQRETTQKLLYREFVEMEARSLLLDLKASVVFQIKKTGGFNLTQWAPPQSETALSNVDGVASSVFHRSLSYEGAISGSVNPELIPNSTSASTTGVLQGLRFRPVADFRLVGTWEPLGINAGNNRAQTTWEVSTKVSVVQVPFSSFTFYASGLHTVLGDSQSDLGRVYAEGDLIVTHPVEAIAPMVAAGSLEAIQGGVMIVNKASPSETRAFESSMKIEDFQAQADGWIFQRDSHPALIVRPVTTAELFSRDPLPYSNKENQRLKPRCDLRILHGIDQAGADIFTLDWSPGVTPSVQVLRALQRKGDALELDFSLWPEEIWLSKVWAETSQPDISVFTVKNARSLKGDFSLATRLNIRVLGSFNVEPPVKKASLMTLGRVISTLDAE